jgi:hypothetical protein
MTVEKAFTMTGCKFSMASLSVLLTLQNKVKTERITYAPFLLIMPKLRFFYSITDPSAFFLTVFVHLPFSSYSYS